MSKSVVLMSTLALMAGCVEMEGAPQDDEALGTVAQEVAVAEYGVALAYGYGARVDARGYPPGALSIPIVIVESTRKSFRIPIPILGQTTWVEVWDSSLNHESAFYRRLVFGPGDRNAADYFADVSYGKLAITSTATVNRLDLRDVGEGDDLETEIKVRAGDRARGDFDFRSFDRNGDGKVDDTELWIVHIDGGKTSGNHNGGSNRQSSPRCPTVTTRTGTTKVCSTVVHLGDTVGFETTVHELLHVLGAYDLYGRWNKDTNFSGATVMGATIISTPDDRRTVLPDAWHRFQLGWERPAVYDIISRTERAGSHTLLPPGQWNGWGNVVIFGGISIGRYLIVEYRKPEGWDQDVRGDALYVWSVEQDEDKGLSIDAGYRNYRTLYLGKEICKGGNWEDRGPGLSGCEVIGSWDRTVPIDGAWHDFYMPNSIVHPRVRVTRTGNGVRLDWETMQCARTGPETSRCWRLDS